MYSGAREAIFLSLSPQASLILEHTSQNCRKLSA
jgi:hypothetical protein